MSRKIIIPVIVDEDLKRAAKAAAMANGESLSTVIRRYLKRYVRYTESKVLCPPPAAPKDQQPNIVINKFQRIDIIDL